MKTSKFFFLGLVSLGLFVASCNDDDDDEDNSPPPAAVNVVVGNWSAYDVSGILAGAGVTGINAEFNADNTYTVESIADGATTTLEGTYVVSEDPNSEGIYTITLNQSSPSSLTAEGIYAVYEASPDSMWYEVAQTTPTITGVTAPTQEDGFGSTSAGAFGTLNIQKYTRQ
jgi:hypothetical protein